MILKILHYNISCGLPRASTHKYLNLPYATMVIYSNVSTNIFGISEKEASRRPWEKKKEVEEEEEKRTLTQNMTFPPKHQADHSSHIQFFGTGTVHK